MVVTLSDLDFRIKTFVIYTQLTTVHLKISYAFLFW